MKFKNANQRKAVMAKIRGWRKIQDDKYALSYSNSSSKMGIGDKFKIIQIDKPKKRIGRVPATIGHFEIEELEITGKYGDYNSSKTKRIISFPIRELKEGEKYAKDYMEGKTVRGIK